MSNDGMPELGRRMGLKVEGPHARLGLFEGKCMTTLCLGVGHLEVRDIVVSVDFVSAEWGWVLRDTVDLDMGRRRLLRHRYHSRMIEGDYLRTLMTLLVASPERTLATAECLMVAV